MLVLAHTGITLGATLLLKGTLGGYYSHSPGHNKLPRNAKNLPAPLVASNTPFLKGRFSFHSLANYLDIRLLLLGSLLPDIIDKPVGQFIFRDIFSNGRIFSHTLLFLVLLSIAGYIIYRSRQKTGLLAIAFGTFMHLLLDRMWLEPKTLFWPALGLSFPQISLSNWTQNIFQGLLNIPEIFIPEIIGLAILVIFTIMLIRRKSILPFIIKGQIEQ